MSVRIGSLHILSTPIGPTDGACVQDLLSGPIYVSNKERGVCLCTLYRGGVGETNGPIKPGRTRV